MASVKLIAGHAEAHSRFSQFYEDDKRTKLWVLNSELISLFSEAYKKRKCIL